ncbi:MAG: histidine phosphatase family protein [Acidobacteriota bacterium]|nr:histidine phosphatase family protein [Acidobacteriota bacterium]
MRTLLLMRHAKAGPSTAGVADFDRPLLEEGRIAAALIGSFLKREKLTVDLAISSPAIRSRETIEAVLQAAGMSLEVCADQRLYEGGSLLLLEVLSEADNDLRTVLLVGHNPVLEDLVQHLTGENVHLSAATLTHVELDAEKWSEIHGAKHKLCRVVQAKELD